MSLKELIKSKESVDKFVAEYYQNIKPIKEPEPIKEPPKFKFGQ